MDTVAQPAGKTAAPPPPPAVHRPPGIVTDLDRRRRIALFREVHAQATAERGWPPDPWPL